MRRAAWSSVLLVAIGLAVPAAAHAKPPKACAALVETTEEVGDLLDEYFVTLDEYNSVPVGDPSEEGLILELDGLETEIRSVDQVLERDITDCEGPKKAPKKCRGLVASTQEVSDVFDDFFAATDEFYSVPEGDPSEQRLITELEQLEGEIRSMDRVLARDLRSCKR